MKSSSAERAKIFCENDLIATCVIVLMLRRIVKNTSEYFAVARKITEMKTMEEKGCSELSERRAP